MEQLFQNKANIIVIIILILVLGYAIISIRKGKGKCTTCGLSSSCPFRNKK